MSRFFTSISQSDRRRFRGAVPTLMAMAAVLMAPVLVVVVASVVAVVVGVSLLAVPGCQQREAPPEAIAIDDRVPPVRETRREEMPQQRLQPVAVMPAEELTLIYRTSGPAQFRVVRSEQAGERIVAEIEAPAGSVLLIDRREGISLGRQRHVAGPLNREATYAVYALPPGGVRQEVTRQTIRPPTPEERQAVLEERREEERRRLEEELRRQRQDDPGDPDDPDEPTRQPGA